MSKFTNVVKSSTRKVTRSVPVYTAKNLVESATIRTRIAVDETKQSRDRYYALKDERKEQERQERAEQKARESEPLHARSAELGDLIEGLFANASVAELVSPDEIIPSDDSEPVHISRPLHAFVGNTRDRVSTTIGKARKQNLGD